MTQSRVDRRDAQDEDDRAQRQLQNARPNEPPDRPKGWHPWDATDEEPCIGGRRQHDYTRKNSDGVRRCWYCSRISPRSRAEMAAREQR
jgi:hypothetical protein